MTDVQQSRTQVLALSGGVGGARVALGLQRVLPAGHLTVVVNTADDFSHLGLAISPDLDTVLYTLAGLNDAERGWGRAGETWRTMAALAELGGPSWFRLGDADLATHLYRTHRLREGATLTQVCAELAARCGVVSGIQPMSDATVRTILDTDDGPMEFQHWFVAEQCRPRIVSMRYDGVDAAAPSPLLAGSLRDAGAIVIGPSNPWLSVEPILRVPGLGSALRARGIPVIGVSPIVGGQAIKGPAARMLEWFGCEVSAFGVAEWYTSRHPDLLDVWVIDSADAAQRNRIEALGLDVRVADTHVHDPSAAAQLAMRIVEWSESLEKVREW